MSPWCLSAAIPEMALKLLQNTHFYPILSFALATKGLAEGKPQIAPIQSLLELRTIILSG